MLPRGSLRLSAQPRAERNYPTKAEARYVAQGHREKQKREMVHIVTSLRQSSTGLVISVAAVKGFRLFSHDVSQYYLQSDEELTWKLLLMPKKKDLQYFQIDTNEIHHLHKPIYGTTYACDYWSVTIDRHAREDLHLKPLLGDPSLYIKRIDEDEDLRETTLMMDFSLGMEDGSTEREEPSSIRLKSPCVGQL